jgi:hypothetical protein
MQPPVQVKVWADGPSTAGTPPPEPEVEIIHVEEEQDPGKISWPRLHRWF